MQELFLVPRENVSLKRMSAIGTRHGWRLDSKSVRASRNTDAPEYRWDGPHGASITLVQDSGLRRHYISVRAPQHAEEVVNLLKEELPTFGDAEIRDRVRAARSEQERADALHLAAARSFDTFDLDIYNLIESALRESETPAAFAAVRAAFHLRWKQLRPLLETVRDQHHSELIRAIAGNLELFHWDRG